MRSSDGGGVSGRAGVVLSTVMGGACSQKWGPEAHTAAREQLAGIS